MGKTVGGLQAQVDVLTRRDEEAGKKAKGVKSRLEGQLKKLGSDVADVRSKVWLCCLAQTGSSMRAGCEGDSVAKDCVFLSLFPFSASSRR